MKILWIRRRGGSSRAAGATIRHAAQPEGLEEADAASRGGLAVEELQDQRLRRRLRRQRAGVPPLDQSNGDGGARRDPVSVRAARHSGAPSQGGAGRNDLPFPAGILGGHGAALVLLPPPILAKLVGGAKALLSASRLRSRRLSSKALQRFSGMAVSFQLAVPSARFFLRRLYDCQCLTGPMSRLSHGVVSDLKWFTKVNTEPGVGRALWPKTLGELTTDASPYAWGGHWHHLLSAAGFFTVAQRDLHINVKEVAAVRFCLLAFGAQLLGEEGLLRLGVDSRVAMHVINGFSSRSPALMDELRKPHEVAQRYRGTLRASWLPSVANVCADALSRQSDCHDWRIADRTFSALQQRYGPYTVYRFAIPLNARCPKFSTKTHAPGTEAVDALSVGWGAGGNNWIYPPLNLAELVVAKIRADKATMTEILLV